MTIQDFSYGLTRGSRHAAGRGRTIRGRGGPQPCGRGGAGRPSRDLRARRRAGELAWYGYVLYEEGEPVHAEESPGPLTAWQVAELTSTPPAKKGYLPHVRRSRPVVLRMPRTCAIAAVIAGDLADDRAIRTAVGCILDDMGLMVDLDGAGVVRSPVTPTFCPPGRASPGSSAERSQ